MAAFGKSGHSVSILLRVGYHPNRSQLRSISACFNTTIGAFYLIMTAFEFFSIALAFVLGLGLAQLLLGGLYVFRARWRQKVDWIPVTFAVTIFIFQIQFWWAIFELNELLESWTHGGFVTLLGSALLLFIAGALILPTSAEQERANLFEYFDQDGRWALLAITGECALSMWGNWFLFKASPFSTTGAIVVALGLISLAAFLSSSRRVLGALAIAMLVMTLWAYLILAPAEY